MDIKYYEFSNPIYPRKIWVMVANSSERILSLFENKEYSIDDKLISNSKAFTCPVINKDTDYLGVLVVFTSSKYITPKNIGHEAQHVLDSFITDLDLEQYPNNRNEHIAYLKGYIDECIWSVKNKKTPYKIFKTK